MSLKNKVLKKLDEHTFEVVQKSFQSLIVKFIGMIVAFLLSIVLGRLLGADGLGIINLTNSFVRMVVIVCLLGNGQIIVREVALGLSKKNFRYIGEIMKSAYKLNGVFSFVFSVAIILLSPWLAQNVFGDPRIKWPLVIGMITIIPQIFSRLWSSGLIGYRKIWQSNLVDYGLRPVITTLIIGLMWLIEIKVTVVNTAIAYALSYALVSVGVGSYWRRLRTKVNHLKTNTRKLFKTSLPLLISSISNILISNGGVILLGFFLSSTEVGLYTVASQLALLSAFMLQITNSALSGNLASLYSQNQKRELQIMIKKITRYLTLFGLIPLIVFIFFGKSILSFWGEEFVTSYWLLIIIAAGQFFNIATGAAGQLLIMCGFQKQQSYITTTFMVLNLILNLILINLYGVIGAAFTIAITTVGMNLIRVIVAKQKTGILTLPI